MFNTDGFNRKIRKLEKLEDEVLKESLPFVKSITPIDSGNARRNTFRDKNKIKGNYPYAGRLDEGWSKQAPAGIIEPSVNKILDNIKKYIRKI